MPELPERPRRQDRHQGRSATTRPRSTKSSRARSTGCRPAAARPLRRSQEQVRRHPVPGRADDQHLLLLDEHEAAPFDDLKVRQAVNYAVDPEALERIYAGSARRTQQILPPGMPGYEKFDLYPHNLAKAKELIKEANPSDTDITVWTDNESPNNEAGDLLPGRAQGTRLQREAEDHQRRQLLHDDRQRNRRPTSTPAGSTGSRTTRTRTTSSSRCWPAKASCRPTTTTSPRSTTRS